MHLAPVRYEAGMIEIAVLTPDPSDPSYAGQWPGVLERLGEALATGGLTAVPTPWTDHVEDAAGLERFPLVLPLIAWGYHRDHGRWMQACATWEAAGVRMLNPPSVLGWNSDKSYLGRLADQGVAIPDTVWVDSPTQADVDAAFDRFGVEQIVVKPRVSGGAWKTLRLSRGEPMIGAPEGPAMIQPYLPTIESEGETSLLYFGGRLSHAVNKRPITGEFRIQVQFGGQYVALPEPPAGALALAEKTLAALNEDLLYARIDMARDAVGGWLLMEAELIEPDFYLGSAPEGGRRFAEAVRARL
ncbi:MAG: transporter [Brevundimonas sp.]|uniref:ATP-grasp domain-containing protein n=1 Tax=Brevundimonas sp. TaxID=1871086 RepID=UPI002732C050|nr:transporter [Brevundimonas sp.]MDP3658065.1 transporter [Brevundimonas sp.]MDZ4111310.1 transporter [Brevundimonas sp.]